MPNRSSKARAVVSEIPCDCKEAATDRVRVAWTVIEVVALNEEKRQHCDVPHASHL